MIAAVRDPEDWQLALESQAAVLFLLCGDIITVKALVEQAKAAGKLVFVHIELLGGLGRDNRAVDFIASEVKPDGIISTRSGQIKHAKELGLLTVQRFFLVDSLSVSTALETAKSVKPDMIEIMPGMPGVVRKIIGRVDAGLIAGGLIEDKEEVYKILSAGAQNISTSRRELWDL